MTSCLPNTKLFSLISSPFQYQKTLNEALTDDNRVKAMKVEMEALENNKTWDLVQLPKGKKLVGCKWVFTPKYNSDGSLERYKARLVAKGFTQEEGIDYTKTFSPVSKKDSFRVVMALVAHFDLELHQMDVKTAFLNGDLEEEVYMK